MLDMNSHLTDLRVDGHKVRLYFGAFVGSVVLTATVDSTPADKALSLPITVVSGSAADVYRGFQVRVYRPDGTTFKGVTNVRAAGTISSTSLPIRELGQADIVIEAGDVVKVYNVPFLGDKLPSDDETFAPDGLTYTTQGSAIAPNTRSGGHRMGMVDTGLTYRTEVMAGSGSATIDPDSSGGGTHLWTLLTGTLAFAPGSASSDANPTIRASVGYGLALHRFTDSSNSAAWSQFVCFQVYDADNPPKRVLDATINGVEDSGWSSEFETYAYSTLADLPDGAMGALFVCETINGIDTSYGASVSGLSHIKCLGFLVHDESDMQPSIRRLRFRLQSPWQRLAGLPGFSKVVTRAASADWTTVEGLTVLLGIFHLLHYYGFFTELFDVTVDPDFLDKAYAQFFLQKQTADGQVKELAAGVDARVTNLRGGALALHTHPCLIPLDERAAVPQTLTIAERDCLKAGIVRDHWKTIETFEGRGLTAGSTTNDPLFSRSPGNTPGRGNVTVSAEKKIWDDQADANERGGRMKAKEDGTYIDANGVQVRAIQWTPTLFGSYDIFDFYKEYVATSLDAASNRRGVDLSAMLYYLNRVSVRYQGGTARVEPTFLTATHEPAGATYVPTPGEVPPTTPPDNIPTPIALPPARLPPYGADTPPTKIIILDSGAAACHTAVTLHIEDMVPVPDYVARSTGLSGNNIDLSADPWDYARYFALQSDGLYRNDDPFGGGSWTLVANYATMFGNASAAPYQIEMSINRNGYIAIRTGYNGFAYSFDLGVTWNHTSINGATYNATFTVAAFLLGIAGHFAVSPYNNGAQGWVYAAVPSLEGATNGGYYKSTDWGATWTLKLSIANNVIEGGANLSVPYMKPGGASANINDTSQLVYAASGTTNNENAFIISPDGGTTWNYVINGSHQVVNTPFSTGSSTALVPFTWDGGIILAASTKSFMHIYDYAALVAGAWDNTSGYCPGSEFVGTPGNVTMRLNGFSNHRWARLLYYGSSPTFYWGFTADAVMTAVAAPVGYTGVGSVEFSLAA